jgi:hypothetical protein
MWASEKEVSDWFSQRITFLLLSVFISRNFHFPECEHPKVDTRELRITTQHKS